MGGLAITKRTYSINFKGGEMAKDCCGGGVGENLYINIKPSVELRIYLDDGRVCVYDHINSMKAREHASAIIKGGLRHNDGGMVEWYPPHRISKVKWESDGTTSYLSRFIET